MRIDAPRGLGDHHSKNVPAAFRGIIGIEVVLAVRTGTAPSLDDILLLVADDDGKIAVLLDPTLGDGLDCAHPTITVSGDDPLGYGTGDRPLVCEVASPSANRIGHTVPLGWGWLNRFGSTRLNRMAFASVRVSNIMRVREGGVEIGTGEAFFNPDQELNRDLTIAVLRAYRDREPRAQRYLDAMSATGIRGVRAARDGWEVTLCDWKEENAELCRANLERNDLEGEVENRDANALLHDALFDVVDLDPYGTPIPFADAAFANARNMVCVTATDTAPLCGAHFESGVRKYSAVPQNTDYHPEMGLRILLSALARTAARYDVGISPIFSHVSRHYVRTYLDLSHSATDGNRSVEQLGYLDHCEDCLHREHSEGLIADPWEACPLCGSNRILTAGPVWLGSVRDREFTERVSREIDEGWGSEKRARRLVERLRAELDTPTHYDQHRLCKEWGRPAEGMDEFLSTIGEAGFETSRAHYHGTAFKTPATIAEIREAIAEPFE